MKILPNIITGVSFSVGLRVCVILCRLRFTLRVARPLQFLDSHRDSSQSCSCSTPPSSPGGPNIRLSRLTTTSVWSAHSQDNHISRLCRAKTTREKLHKPRAPPPPSGGVAGPPGELLRAGQQRVLQLGGGFRRGREAPWCVPQEPHSGRAWIPGSSHPPVRLAG